MKFKLQGNEIKTLAKDGTWTVVARVASAADAHVLVNQANAVDEIGDALATVYKASAEDCR